MNRLEDVDIFNLARKNRHKFVLNVFTEQDGEIEIFYKGWPNPDLPIKNYLLRDNWATFPIKNLEKFLDTDQKICPKCLSKFSPTRYDTHIKHCTVKYGTLNKKIKLSILPEFKIYKFFSRLYSIERDTVTGDYKYNIALSINKKSVSRKEIEELRERYHAGRFFYGKNNTTFYLKTNQCFESFLEKRNIWVNIEFQFDGIIKSIIQRYLFFRIFHLEEIETPKSILNRENYFNNMW